MQNKQVVVGLVAAAVIILGAGFVYLFDKTKPASQPNRTVATQITPAKNSVAGTVADIFKTSKDEKCTFDSKTSDSETNGTIYATANKAYGTFAMTSSGKTTTNYVIRDTDNFYIWGSSLPTGIKMTMSVDDLAKNISSSQYSGGFNANQKVDYNCSNWTVDESVFTPPTNVKFTNFGGVALPSAASSNKTANPSSQCSICASLTGQAKSACLSSFHCQ